MEPSTLRSFALGYLHLVVRHFDSLLNTGLYQTSIIIFFLLICGALAFLHNKGNASSLSRFVLSTPFYCATLLIAVVWSRIPWLAAGELNVDESMFLASARKLMFDPVFFRAVDGGTSGPLNYYAVLLPKLFGLPFDYATTHLMSALCAGGALVFLYLIARGRLPEMHARVAVLPMLCTVMSFRSGELLHYSSECASMLLIAAAAFLFLSSFDTPQLRPWKFFSIGAIVCALPLAKLQSGPCGMILGISALLFAAYRFRTSGRKDGKAAVLYCLAGGATVVIATFVLLAAFGQVSEFLKTYIEYNISYVTFKQVIPWTLTTFLEFCSRVTEVTNFLLVTLAYVLFIALLQVWLKAWPRPWTSDAIVYVFALALFAASIYSVYKPARPFPHYWLYTIFPASLVLVLGLKIQKRGGLWAFILITLLAPLYWSTGLPKRVLVSLSDSEKVACSICEIVARYAKPGDLVSVWGWDPEIYVRTATVHASRESFTERQVSDYPQRPFFIQRYVNDLNEHPPVVFVDAVASNHFFINNRPSNGHDAYPAVRALINSQFDYLEDFDGYRIYVRKGVLLPSDRSHPWTVQPVPEQESGELIADIRWTADAAWTKNSHYPDVGNLSEGEMWSSYGGDDSKQGKIVSSPIEPATPGCIVVPITHGPRTSGQHVRIVDSDSNRTVADLPLNAQVTGWSYYKVQYKSAPVQIEAEDAGSGWGQWTGVGQPRSCK